MKKIGILGGTFDPIHWGHLVLAEHAKEEAGLDQVIFMPAMIQPFKINKKVTSSRDRYEMIRRAIKGNNSFKVSSKELDSPNISYTINTLRSCRDDFGISSEIFFIMGTDTFLDIEKWYKSKELLTEFSFIVGYRPGYKEDELLNCIEHIREKYNTNIIQLNNRRIEISSTDIKERVKNRKSIRYLVSKEVEEYINDSKLYL
ncbi:nicotinate-nucleotide adenylyltransferase [Anaerovorax odorimutans]|uniref:nicotinate-nucleotide adenylyltransferase n=1 Tax=Anaerovorax odorimutans TaxID=109327 RepID=UPI00040F7928|nr:nicotinate-nucleotide adenylyltransferase [Anaerovorax odorimutans]